ncbi:MAG TPA: HAMP domain-containing sensor histidine kinase [Thermomicrobiales bacterium]|nr:HAMP domain-containing sensor histidine kinase [Thermomicrobiales bacterium]
MFSTGICRDTHAAGTYIGTDLMQQLEIHSLKPNEIDAGIAVLAIHDLKGAIHAIQGFLSVLRSEQAGPLTAIQHDFVASAFITSRRIERLVDDLQVLGTNTGTLSLIPENCNLQSIIEMCVRELTPTAVGFQVQVDIRGDPEGSWTLVADTVRIEQIAFNLIENAIRYADVDSTVVVRLRKSLRQLLLVVENQCAASATSEPEQWFQPFQRSEYAVQTGRRGLGIGLTVVQTLTAAHSGSVYSRVRGTTVSFAVRLPRRMVNQES